VVKVKLFPASFRSDLNWNSDQLCLPLLHPGLAQVRQGFTFHGFFG
jgi:hypothetical protein